MAGATSPATALHVDEYELTMSQSFWRHGQDEEASFELFVRSLPPNRGYLVTAGLATALDYLQRLRFTDGDLEFLESQGLYDRGFLDHLAGLRFTGTLDAVPEGTLVAAGTPLLRVTAPRISATLVESALLSIVNQQTMIASKAARVVTAAAGRPCWDFSLRRLHGPQAATAVARAAWIAGFAGTATVAAARDLGIPSTGTMAHHFVQRFGEDREQEAFAQFLRDYPGRAVMLVDTYDTRRGVRRAIAAAGEAGIPLQGVRLDSGDLEELARFARTELDAAGFTAARVVASGDLDEWRIEEIVAAGAPVDSFGVGTMLGTSYDAPALGGVYKLVEQRGGPGPRAVMKKAGAKTTDPGRHQVFRGPDGDTLGLEDEELEGRPLLRRVRLDEREPLGEARRRCAAELALLPPATLRITEPVPLQLRRSQALCELRRALGDPEPPTAAEGARFTGMPAVEDTLV